MKHELTIDTENPFLNDELDRFETANILTDFALSSEESTVICIDAPWGQGKTTFLKMWEQHLKNSKIPTIYYNAWENDFTDDALISIIGEISAKTDVLATSNDISNAKKHLEQAKSLGVNLIKRTLPVAAKVATAGALDLDKITEQALANLAESVAKEELERYEKSKTTLSNFRTSLEKFAADLSPSNSKKPLVFIIDELDRCRPDFSIEILEKIKHFFSVPNILFVLGADKVQLGHSIRSIYGSGINVDGYLRRFIDFDYLLPPPKKGKFAKVLFEKFHLNCYFSSKTSGNLMAEKEQALEMFSELFDVYKMSLREQQHCCSLLQLAIRTTPHSEQLFPIFLCFLIVLKVKDTDLYKSFTSEEIEPLALLETLKNKSQFKNIFESKYSVALEAYLVTSKVPYEYGPAEVEKIYQEKLNSQTDIIRSERILRLIEQYDSVGGIGTLGYLINKIEIASRFKS